LNNGSPQGQSLLSWPANFNNKSINRSHVAKTKAAAAAAISSNLKKNQSAIRSQFFQLLEFSLVVVVVGSFPEVRLNYWKIGYCMWGYNGNFDMLDYKVSSHPLRYDSG